MQASPLLAAVPLMAAAMRVWGGFMGCGWVSASTDVPPSLVAARWSVAVPSAAIEGSLCQGHETAGSAAGVLSGSGSNANSATCRGLVVARR